MKTIIIVAVALLIVLLLNIGMYNTYNCSVPLLVSLNLQANTSSFERQEKNQTLNYQEYNNPNNNNSQSWCLENVATLRIQHSNSTSFLYNRVPKCGSRGLASLFNKLSYQNRFVSKRRQYRNMVHHVDEDGARSIISEMNRYRNLRKSLLYIRHVHFINFTNFSEQMPTYINVVRDPFKRMVSSYYFRRQVFRYSKEDKERSFDDCVKMNISECVEPIYTFVVIPFFCGLHDYCLQPCRKALEQAKYNVVHSFPVVGYLEKLDEFLEVLELYWPQMFHNAKRQYQDMLGMSNTDNVKHKTTFAFKQEPSNGIETIMKSRKEFVYEYEFYNFIVKRFDCLYNSVKSQIKN